METHPDSAVGGFKTGYNHFGDSMDTTEIIRTIDAEIARLKQARELLSGHVSAPVKRGRPFSSTTAAKSKPRKRRMISAEGRARIAAAQKARWAKAKG
jgi:hypothetical protein